MNGKHQCDNCAKSISRYEVIVRDWLEENNVVYIPQYTFKDCRHVLPLPFDFYLPDKNVLIEVDGEGHYGLAYFNRCSKEKAELAFERIQVNDDIKTAFCKEHQIPLIRIPYWDIKNNSYINILTNIIKD